MAAGYSIGLTDAPDPRDRATAARALMAHNAAFLGPVDSRPLAALLRDPDGNVIGGVWGRTALRWLFVEMVFVPEALRGRGIGAELLRAAETEARGQGCLGAWLDTFSPPARDFYLNQGYEPFGEIGDYPPGHARYFLRKRFAEVA